MKRLKIIIFVVLFSIGFSFNGELYMLYLDTFQDSYFQTNFYPEQSSSKKSNEMMIQDFVNAGKKCEVDFFVIERTIQSAYEEAITISGTEKALWTLQKQGIQEGTKRSLFFGQVKVNCQPFQKITTLSEYDTWYLVGEKENLDAFKASLIDQYGGGFPRQFGSNRETWMNLLFVWGILFSLALIITLYGVVYQRKETVVRIILGENLSTIFIKNTLVDTFWCILIFLFLPQLLSTFTNTTFKHGFISILFFFFLCLNALLHTGILRVRFKRDLANANHGEGLLMTNYCLKIAATVLVILILAGNVATIRQTHNLYIQRDFFKSHRNYSYCQLNYKSDNRIGKSEEDDIAMNQEFYQRFQNQSLQYVDLTDNFNSPYPVLLHNRTAMKELQREYPTLKTAIEKAKKEKVYLLLPSSLSRSSNEYRVAMEIANTFFGDAGYGRIKTIPYESGIEVTGIHRLEDYQMNQYSDPIMLYNNATFQKNESMTGYDTYYMYDTMYTVSETEWNSFLGEFQLENQIAARSNVLDIYEHSWKNAYRNLRITLVLSVFLIFLEMTLILFILQLEYRFHAMELALKRVLGHSLFSRNRIILTVTLISSMIGILLAFIISSQLGVPGGYPLLFIGLVMILVEMSYILWRAKKMERAKTVAILKGERV